MPNNILEKLQDKIGGLADDFANGNINRQQFQKLYAHYQREVRAIETLIETDQGHNELGDAFHEGESVLIRQQHAAKRKGMPSMKMTLVCPLVLWANLK